MLDYPKTRKEAEKYRYGTWAGNPKGNKYRAGKCAYEVWADFIAHQCSRNWGHGPDGLYCKQHARILER